MDSIELGPETHFGTMLATDVIGVCIHYVMIAYW